MFPDHVLRYRKKCLWNKTEQISHFFCVTKLFDTFCPSPFFIFLVPEAFYVLSGSFLYILSDLFVLLYKTYALYHFSSRLLNSRTKKATVFFLPYYFCSPSCSFQRWRLYVITAFYSHSEPFFLSLSYTSLTWIFCVPS